MLTNFVKFCNPFYQKQGKIVHRSNVKLRVNTLTNKKGDEQTFLQTETQKIYSQSYKQIHGQTGKQNDSSVRTVTVKNVPKSNAIYLILYNLLCKAIQLIYKTLTPARE